VQEEEEEEKGATAVVECSWDGTIWEMKWTLR